MKQFFTKIIDFSLLTKAFKDIHAFGFGFHLFTQMNGLTCDSRHFLSTSLVQTLVYYMSMDADVFDDLSRICL